MKLINIKVNEKTKAGKAILTMVEALNGQEGVVVKVETSKPNKTKSSNYNPEFVKKILQARKSGKFVEIDINDIWGSIGLK